MTRFNSELEILDIVEKFKDRSLPPSRWTHEAHLITGLWFHREYGLPEALCYLRSGIISYNQASGGENTHEKGYHETLTIFWCKILHHYIYANGNLPFIDLCNSFLESKWASKDLPLKFYTRERLFSVEARAMWVEPNLTGPGEIKF